MGGGGKRFLNKMENLHILIWQAKIKRPEVSTLSRLETIERSKEGLVSKLDQNVVLYFSPKLWGKEHILVSSLIYATASS